MALTTGIRTLYDLDLDNQVVFVRTDLDCPTSKSGQILDDSRILETCDVLRTLMKSECRILVGSRFGEVSRARKNSAAFSIEPAAARLAELLECEVLLPDGCTGDAVKKVLMEMRPGRIGVVENLALEGDRGPEMEAFARQLHRHADVFVADSVRALAVESATTTLLPRLVDDRVASPSMMKELSAVDRIRSGIDDPRVIVWGGNALSARLDVLDELVTPGTQVLLCGVPANTMVRALGGQVGKSAIEEDYLAGARSLADKLGSQLVVPSDFLAGASPKAQDAQVRDARRVPEDEMALDIGPETQAAYRKFVESAKTAIWCGTIGFHKSETFHGGTRALGEAFSRTSAFTMVAGDDSVAAVRATMHEDLHRIDCVARGGPATLALLKETKLVGIQALRGTT